MRLEPMEDRGGGSSSLHRLDARVKLVVAVGFIVAVLLTPIGWWRVLGLLGLALAFLIGLAGVSPSTLFRRWAGLLILVGFLAAMVAPGVSSRAGVSIVTVVTSILLKNSLAFLMMLVLAEVTPWRSLLLAMSRLGVPRVLVATLQFMERYLHVLGDDVGRGRGR